MRRSWAAPISAGRARTTKIARTVRIPAVVSELSMSIFMNTTVVPLALRRQWQDCRTPSISCH
jgi:hypothetical protein